MALTSAADHVATMESRLLIAENDARDLASDMKAANAEIEMLRGQLKEALDDNERLKRHGHEVRARAEAVGEAVIQMIRKSREEAAKPLVPKSGEEQRTTMTPEEQEAFIQKALSKPPEAFVLPGTLLAGQHQ